MKILEWIVWAIGCAAVIMTIGDIRKGGAKRRFGISFMAMMIPALALTLLPSVSKFHVAWVLPVAVVISFVLMLWGGWRSAKQLMGLQMELHEKMEQWIREAAARTPPLDLPSFGTLRWDGTD